MFGMGMYELMIIGVLAVVLFGSRLPEVARNIGGSYREFRKGLNDIQSQVVSSYNEVSSPTSSPAEYDYDDYEEPTAPKFEPPPAPVSEDSDN